MRKFFVVSKVKKHSLHSSVVAGRLGCCSGTLKCLALATAEAQGSNRTAAQEKVLHLEETWGLRVTKSSATARKKQEEKQKMLRAARSSQ